MLTHYTGLAQPVMIGSLIGRRTPRPRPWPQ